MIAASNEDNGFQGPTSGKIAETYGDLLRIVMHPAFRIGFLDARNDKPFDHDHIVERIEAETPPRAFERMGISPLELRDPHEVEMAQYRYEEGRLLWLIEEPKVRAWGHPDYPPRAIYDYLWKRCEPELKARAEEVRKQFDGVSIVDAMRERACIVPEQSTEVLPLFGARP